MTAAERHTLDALAALAQLLIEELDRTGATDLALRYAAILASLNLRDDS